MSSPILNVTARDIISSAFYAAGIVPANQVIQSFEIDRGLEALNYLIKHWQAQDLHLWAMSEAVIPLNEGQEYYDLGPSGAEVATSDSFFATNLEADQVASDVTLTLYDLAGITAAPGILSFSPTITTTGWTPTNATVGSDGTSLTVTNSGAAAGYADYTLEVESGKDYNLTIEHTGGTSATSTFSVISGATLATSTTAAPASVQLKFTATSDTVTFRVANVSIVATETTICNTLQYQKVEDGERIGIELDDGTRFWDNVISIDTVNDQVDIYTGLPSAAANGNIVYTYGEGIDRPLRLLQLRYTDRSDRSEIPTQEWSRAEYFDQPDKDSKGTVVQWYYDPQLAKGRLYVWQTANNVNNVARITYIRPLAISVDTIDNPDIPSEWVNALKWNVAKELAIEYGIKSRLELIMMRAAESLDLSLGYDVEKSFLSVQPDFTGR